jgi:RHS repeat-associated protein
MVKIGNNTNDWEMYVDGQTVPMAGDNNVQLTGVNVTNNEPLILGGRSYGGGFIERLQGSMKGANIYLRALPTAEIVERFAQGCNLAPANTDALLLSMPLTDGEGNTTANNAAGGQIGNIVQLSAGTAWTTDPTPNLCNTSPSFVVLQECVGGTSYVQGGYRYGFNGKENDNEVEGEGNQQDYGMRIYDPRLGRFLSVDPLTGKYPWYTPYQFAGNKPINSIDLDGLEEYESYDAYLKGGGTKAQNKMDGTDGVWLKSDRESKNGTWKSAMEYITKNNDASKLRNIETNLKDNSNVEGYPFAVVRDYYNYLQKQVDIKGYKSKWAIGASYLVDELADTYMEGGAHTGGSFDDMGDLLTDLNIGIATFAVSMFKDILYLDGAKGKASFLDWYKWDLSFIQQEQGPIALGIYKQYDGSKALNQMNTLARKECCLGWGAGIMASIGAGHYFPSFAKFDVTINDATTNFGQTGRINIPMYMLWPSTHQTMSGVKLNNDQQNSINKANAAITEYYKSSSGMNY